MSAKRATFYLFILVLLGRVPARAYDESVHHAVLQVLARNMGYSPQAAALIADASQSMDDQDRLTAFSQSKVADEARSLFTDLPSSPAEKWKVVSERAVNLDHMCAGQIYHALTEHRSEVEQLHLARINRALQDPDKHNLAMVYLGEYLHFLSDSVVHPVNPMLGHAAELDVPDRPEDDVAKFHSALLLMKEKLAQFDSGEVKSTNWQYDSHGAMTVPVASRSSTLSNLDKELAQTVVDHTFKPNRLQQVDEAARTGNADFCHVFDEQRERMLVVTLSGFVQDHISEYAQLERENLKLDGEEEAVGPAQNGFQAHRTIVMDGQGEPLNDDYNVSLFGKVQTIENTGSFFGAASSPELVSERRTEVLTAGALAFREPAEAAFRALVSPSVSEAANGLPYRAVTAIGRTMWTLPKSPGGVALNPRLALPESVDGVREIAVEDDGVTLVTDSGRYPVDSVDPQSFATILRCVSAGQIPFITIGSEPSGKPGFARVTYSPSLIGTREGALLYRADIQFKAIFAHYPFGTDLHLNTASDALAGGFPGSGGEFMRLWITSSDIALRLEGGHLTPERNGMRIQSETTLMGDVVEDPTMDRYARKLTDNWDAIASDLPEFRAVQELALETALAFWVREHRVPVSEIIWTIPDKGDFTPEFAPLVAFSGASQGVCGGVSLAPEDRYSASGHALFHQLAALVDAWERSNGSGLVIRTVMAGVAGGLGLAVVVFSGTWFWALQKQEINGKRVRLRYPRALGIWALFLLLLAVPGVIVSPFLVGRALCRFDREFLGLSATMVAAPLIFYWLVPRLVPSVSGRRPDAWTFVLALWAPLFTGLCGTCAALATVALVGVVPSVTTDRVLTAELAPLDCLTQATTSVATLKDGSFEWLPFSGSMAMSGSRQFERRVASVDDDQESLTFGTTGRDVLFPGAPMRRIHWPEDVEVDPGTKQFSVDGRPPYETEEPR